MSITSHTLSTFYLFADLDDRARVRIVRELHERSFEPGEVLSLSNEPCQSVYLIFQGVVRVQRLSYEGREYILGYVGAGDCLNLVAALDSGSTLATGEALTRTVAYAIPCDRFRQIVQENHPVALASLARLATRVRLLSDTVEDLALHTVRTRLARFLLARTDHSAYPVKQWTQEEIAAHIGTVRDVVGRSLRSFAKEGLIRRQRGRLAITDREGLERIAEQI